MITLTKIRDLHLAVSETAQLHLSAASGLVCVRSFLYVVADDELHLGVFRKSGDRPGHLVRLFDGELPALKPDRKKLKPDLEALVRLPASADFPDGALLALGSGSKKNRRMGALLRLDAEGALLGVSEAVDLSPVFTALEGVFHATNIEGAVVVGNEIRLFQRGNKKHAQNAIVRFSLPAFLTAVASMGRATIEPLGTLAVDLGEVDGVPLCFTDAAALPGGDIVFTAVAEDTDDAYDDGPCEASAVGVLDRNGHLRGLHRLDGGHKVEGVDARLDGDLINLLLVTDADDPEIPASLFLATIARPPV